MTPVTLSTTARVAWVLARLKGVAAFLGGLLSFAVTAIPLPGPQIYWTGAAAILTWISVYTVPNLQAVPRRALTDDSGEPVVA